jgi:hypothetical protein
MHMSQVNAYQQQQQMMPPTPPMQQKQQFQQQQARAVSNQGQKRPQQVQEEPIEIPISDEEEGGGIEVDPGDAYCEEGEQPTTTGVVIRV